MKKQFLALAVAAATTLSAQAEVIKYEATNIFANVQNSFPSLELDRVEGASVWIEKTDDHFGQSFKLKRLVIDMANNSDLVINDFDSPHQDRYFNARTPGWVFRDLTVRGEFKDNNEYPELGDLTIAVSPDPKSENKYEEELVTFNFGELVRTGANPVADVARLNIKSKNLTLKLLTRKQRFDEFGGLSHVIDASWMGYGNKLLPIHVPTNSDLIGMRLVNMGDHPEHGSDYEVFVKYEREDGSVTEEPAGMLSYMLDVYKR